MEFRSLKRKNTTDQSKLDLAQPTMMFLQNKNSVKYRTHIVIEDEITRPDLIAIKYYGGPEHTDYLLKWNGISDPFSLVPGDELQIPPKNLSISTLQRPTNFAEENNPIKNQFLQDKNERLPEKDKRRLDALKKKYNKEVLLPPNVIALGKKTYKFDKEGNIILGAQAQNADVNPANPDPVVEEVLADIEGVGSPQGGGTGISSGSGGGRGLTQTQLEKNLNDGQGPRRDVINAQTGSGAGRGTSATNYGGGQSSGDAPQGSGDATNVSNDGAPCN